MKQNIYLLLLFFLLSSFTKDRRHKPVLYEGNVSCNQQGIAGVGVTDGTTVCLTDKNGNYSIRVSNEAKFVYILSPAGYSVPFQNSVPKFYQALPSSSKKKEKINFELNKIEGGDFKHGFVVWADPQIKTNEDVVILHEVANDLKALLSEYKNVPFYGLGCGDIVDDNSVLFDSIKSMLCPI